MTLKCICMVYLVATSVFEQLLKKIVQICSLSTILREYVALRSICSLPFKDLILTAVDIDSKTEDRAWKISRPLTNFIESNHNKSQLEAINVSFLATRF